MDSIRVVIVDDHALFRAGIANLLRKQPGFSVVGEAGNGIEALERVTELVPDIVLMDIYMPEMNGLDATRRIRDSLPSVKVVMLSVSGDRDHVFEALKAGAQAYLLKAIEPRTLIQTLEAVSRGEVHIAGDAAINVLSELGRLATSRVEEERLSPRQRVVLIELSKGVSNKEIGLSLGISEYTVKNHVKSILARLHLENRAQAVAFALRNGIAKQTV